MTSKSAFKAISMFAGGGIGESRLGELGIHVVRANELLQERASLFRKINPATEMITGDIRDETSLSSLVGEDNDIDFLLATPPCQGVSIAGKNKTLDARLLDPRNYLIFEVLKTIDLCRPRLFLIENVVQYLNLLLPNEGNLMPVVELLKQKLGGRYRIDFKTFSTYELGVPQDRKRAFIVGTRLDQKEFQWPSPILGKTVRDTIGDLPSLEAGEKSGIPWHMARTHNPNQITWMKHTPTGHSAFENKTHYPKKPNGERIKAYNTTYRRMEWDKPAPAITMRNDAISSQMNVHPGHLLADGTYSDARVLTPLELLRLNSMRIEAFEHIEISELILRRSLGESVPPLALNNLLKGWI